MSNVNEETDKAPRNMAWHVDAISHSPGLRRPQLVGIILLHQAPFGDAPPSLHAVEPRIEAGVNDSPLPGSANQAFSLNTYSGGGASVLEVLAYSDTVGVWGRNDMALYTGPFQVDQAQLILAKMDYVNAGTRGLSAWRMASCSINGNAPNARLRCSSEGGRLKTFWWCPAQNNSLYPVTAEKVPPAGCQVVELRAKDLGS